MLITQIFVLGENRTQDLWLSSQGLQPLDQQASQRGALYAEISPVMLNSHVIEDFSLNLICDSIQKYDI